MPHTDPHKACAEVARHLKDIPAWPQLPARSFLENMYVQYSEGFPGIVVLPEEKRIYVDSSKDIQQPLEELYAAYLADDGVFVGGGDSDPVLCGFEECSASFLRLAQLPLTLAMSLCFVLQFHETALQSLDLFHQLGGRFVRHGRILREKNAILHGGEQKLAPAVLGRNIAKASRGDK